MLKGVSLAKRSVKVLLNKLEGNTEEQVKFLEFLKTINELYRRNKNFRDLVLNEQLPLEEKEKVFEELSQKFDLENKELAKEFLVFLTKHHGFKYLSLIIRAYQYELENVLGTVKAEIVTASELSEELKRQLVQTLENKLNRKVEATFAVNPDIIGGFVVKTTSFVVDASVRDLLKELAMKI
jgi:F-type H+-transporting ATPase subunit delta